MRIHAVTFHTLCYYYLQQSEPLDTFIPVDFSKPSLTHAFSDFSITTKLDRLDLQSSDSLGSNSNVSSMTEKMDLDFPRIEPVPPIDTPYIYDAELNLAVPHDSRNEVEAHFDDQSTSIDGFTTVLESDITWLLIAVIIL